MSAKGKNLKSLAAIRRQLGKKVLTRSNSLRVESDGLTKTDVARRLGRTVSERVPDAGVS